MIETSTLLALAYVVIGLAVVALGLTAAGIAVLVRDRAGAPVSASVRRGDLARAA